MIGPGPGPGPRGFRSETLIIAAAADDDDEKQLVRLRRLRLTLQLHLAHITQRYTQTVHVEVKSYCSVTATHSKLQYTVYKYKLETFCYTCT